MADPSLVSQGWVCDKPCLVTVDIRAYVTLARPDIAAGWFQRQPNRRCMLHRLFWEALPIMKQVFLTLNQGRRPLKICVFVANITNVFILGPDIRCICGPRGPNAASCRGRGINIGLGLRPSRLVVANDQMILAQCEAVVMARLEGPRSGKWPGRTESGGPSFRRTLHSQDPGLGPTGGTPEDPECYPP
jgi:hypothetical protein